VEATELELCDDGALGGCDSLCSGPTPGYTCSGGDLVTPTVCIPPTPPPAPPAPATPPVS